MIPYFFERQALGQKVCGASMPQRMRTTSLELEADLLLEFWVIVDSAPTETGR